MATVYPKEYFIQATTEKVQRATCFVLMPFASKFKEVYDIIKEILEEELNIQCNRADEIRQPHIIETVLNQIVHSEFIIADLTEANTNVFYELGLTHCIKDANKVIILTQDEDIPFDLIQFHCIIYKQSIEGSKKLREELVNTFNELTKNTFRLKVKENETLPFSKRLIGERNCMYELEITCPYIGYDAIKMQIEITRFGFDSPSPGTKLPNQFLYLGNDKLTEKIDFIPWNVSFVKALDKEAIILIEKQ